MFSKLIINNKDRYYENKKFNRRFIKVMRNGEGVADVKTPNEFIKAIAEKPYVILENDITINQLTEFNLSECELDLNGHILIVDNTDSSKDTINIVNGCHLTINDSTGKGKLINTNNRKLIKVISEDENKKSKLTINGGYFESASYWDISCFKNSELIINDGTFINHKIDESGEGGLCVCGNGSNGQGNVNIIINGGYFESNDIAIYHPQQSSTMTINGGYFKAKNNGIQIKNGTLNMFGGTIVTDGKKVVDVEHNGSGTSDTGCGLSIITAQYPSAKIEVNIGGTANIISNNANAICSDVTNPKDKSSTQFIKLNISNGKFSGFVNGVPNALEFNDWDLITNKHITGGTFNSDVTKYVDKGFKCENNNGEFTIVNA